MQKFKFTPKHVWDILWFKESCILISLEVLDHNWRTRSFARYLFFTKLEDHKYFHIREKSTYEWIRFLSKAPKSQLWAILGLSSLLINTFYTKIRLHWLFYSAILKLHTKRTEKTNEQFLWSCVANRGTNYWMVRQTAKENQIHWKLLLAWVTNNI